MSKDIVIWLEGEKPIGWQKFYSGFAHWAPRQAEAQRCHDLVTVTVRSMQLAPVTNTPVDVLITVFFSGQLMDPDNINDKFYIDGLVPELLPDDSPEYIRWTCTRSLHAEENPGILITITPVELTDRDIPLPLVLPT